MLIFINDSSFTAHFRWKPLKLTSLLSCVSFFVFPLFNIQSDRPIITETCSQQNWKPLKQYCTNQSLQIMKKLISLWSLFSSHGQNIKKWIFLLKMCVDKKSKNAHFSQGFFASRSAHLERFFFPTTSTHWIRNLELAHHLEKRPSSISYDQLEINRCSIID